MVQVEVSNLFFTEMDSSGVTLVEKDGDRKLQIIVGDFEAQSIALGLENIKPPRPITHDLILSVMETAGLNIEKLVITQLKNNTYYAELHVEVNGITSTVDTRPSDGLAIAVRTDLPIYVNEDVFEKIDYSIDIKNVTPIDEDKSSTKKKIDVQELPLNKLKKELNKAVESEDYEKAASIRDQISIINKNQ